TGAGIDELKAVIDRLLADAPPPADLGRPRIWIDRVFTVKGSGTVVTGTLLGGRVEVEDELGVIPSGDLVRVRGMQLHNRAIHTAQIGSRVALNITGMERDLHRGDALVAPDQMVESKRLNVWLKCVPSLERPIVSGAVIKCCGCTAERSARIKLLDREQLDADEEGLAQITLDEACAARWHDRFVI